VIDPRILFRVAIHEASHVSMVAILGVYEDPLVTPLIAIKWSDDWVEGLTAEDPVENFYLTKEQQVSVLWAGPAGEVATFGDYASDEAHHAHSDIARIREIGTRIGADAVGRAMQRAELAMGTHRAKLDQIARELAMQPTDGHPQHGLVVSLGGDQLRAMLPSRPRPGTR
jgi:hypothetical protein